MARQRKEKIDSLWFHHDYDARSNELIIKLIRDKGWEAYGLFWAITEKMHQAGGDLELDYEGIAYDLRSQPELIKSIINDFQLYEISTNGKKFYSRRVRRNIAERIIKSELSRLKARKRWGYDNVKEDATALPQHCNGNAIKKERKKEIKKERKKSKNPPISSGEVKDLKGLNWDQQKIKQHFLNREYSEADIDKAMGKHF